MRNLAVIVLCALAIASADVNVKKAFEDSKIVPDLIPKAPRRKMEVKWGDKAANLGNELTPTETKDIPEVHYHHGWGGDYHIIVMMDADDPTPYQHWLVGNILGDNVPGGEVLTEYIGAGAPKGDKPHRYAMLVYKQKGPIIFNERRISNTDSNRGNFSMVKMQQKYDLKGPIAGNLMRVQYDKQVDKLFHQLKIPGY